MGNQANFFDFAAVVGLTKHIGGNKATEELLELCHISEGKYILDVGCGVGATRLRTLPNILVTAYTWDVSKIDQ